MTDPVASEMSGDEQIAAERQRQISRENWTSEHDDALGPIADLLREHGRLSR